MVIINMFDYSVGIDFRRQNLNRRQILTSKAYSHAVYTVKVKNRPMQPKRDTTLAQWRPIIHHIGPALTYPLILTHICDILHILSKII